MTTSPSSFLARLVETDGFTVRPEAVEFATWMVLDTLTVALAGSRMESDVVRSVGATMTRTSSEGASAAFPIGRRLTPSAAAAVNACAVHSIDYDDSYMAGGVKAHFSSSIIPAAMAVAEDIEATGAQFLDAVVRGFEVAARLGGKARLTLDPSERHGFEYQSWFGFTIYADGVAGALGRGGSYRILGPDEPAIGFSLFPDALIDALAGQEAARDTLFLPLGHDPVHAERLRAIGWRTVAAICEACEPKALGCTHRLLAGEAVRL